MLVEFVTGYMILFIVIMVIAVKIAPLGYEDETGFHYGKRKY